MSKQQENFLGPVVVYGAARPQGSKRIVAPPGRRARLVEDCEQSRPWRNSVSELMWLKRPAHPLDTAVHVELRVYVRRPKAHFGEGRNAGVLKASAPTDPPAGIDLDKVQRAIGDAGTGVWWSDDQRIASWNVRRLYTPDRERVEITAWVLDSETANGAQQ